MVEGVARVLWARGRGLSSRGKLPQSQFGGMEASWVHGMRPGELESSCTGRTKGHFEGNYVVVMI